MKTFVRLFVSSAGFGFVIAVAYWFIAHQEAAGTALLGVMMGALIFSAGYALVAERHADLEGDDPARTAKQAAGDTLGIFTTGSSWPILIALCALALLLGVLWSPFLAVLALAALLLCLWRLGAESART
ncbi:MAG: cytochrome c oxidase subunit 4 [Candidatus Eremiobacteraeota bacterium]|nr:cytochrome c oxidase subunit 4 [Candidatus Eremiobacteraeota bacterium]